MNEIVNRFLLAGDKFMYSRQAGFTYSVCGSFTKTKRKKKFKGTEDS